MSCLILVPILLPGIVGLMLLLSYLRKYVIEKNNEILSTKIGMEILVGSVLLVSVIVSLVIAWNGDNSITLFKLVDKIPIYFNVDKIGRLFITFTSIIWLCVYFYAIKYMKHEGKEKKFYGFYLLTYSVLIALDLAGNMITFYFFYEMMTLVSAPLVLHSGSRKSIMGALKYLFFSMCGAYCALFGIYFLNKYCDTLTFTPKGTLNMELVAGNKIVLLIAIFVMIIGFGTKAGMLPLHGWLSAAHPVAPSPASAVLSAIIVKAGVLAIIRSIYYVVGYEFIKGTWVQYTWIIITLLTVFMGSMLAYIEKNFKRRLAYSTISQVSYILFGLSLFNEVAFTGSILHIVFHAIIKSALFLIAGIFIIKTDRTDVDDYRGIGKKMPITLWCFTIVSLALVGVPPLSGFISKWYLAIGGLKSHVGILGVIGVIVLLVSALLTAGYLLPITVNGFLPGKEFNIESDGVVVEREKIDKMVVVLVILTIVALILGILPNTLVEYASKIATMLI